MRGLERGLLRLEFAERVSEVGAFQAIAFGGEIGAGIVEILCCRIKALRTDALIGAGLGDMGGAGIDRVETGLARVALLPLTAVMASLSICCSVWTPLAVVTLPNT